MTGIWNYSRIPLGKKKKTAQYYATNNIFYSEYSLAICNFLVLDKYIYLTTLTQSWSLVSSDYQTFTQGLESF